ncbi:MAG: rhodanese-like domain-containing protein [Gammaproteobacteria bacterium]
MSIANIAAYKFIQLTKLPFLRENLESCCYRLAIKGTILLAKEGINLMLAGEQTNIESLVEYLQADERFFDLRFKWSVSKQIPFKKLRVRIKDEIIALKHANIDAVKAPVPYISASELKAYLDEKCDFLLLDTRNNYEVSMGSFTNAVDLNIANFREFPQACQQIAPHYKAKPVVTFCTGGIRCEKAAIMLKSQGFDQVMQLQDGILQYFSEYGGAHFRGDCFVFDERLTVDTNLAHK